MELLRTLITSQLLTGDIHIADDYKGKELKKSYSIFIKLRKIKFVFFEIPQKRDVERRKAILSLPKRTDKFSGIKDQEKVQSEFVEFENRNKTCQWAVEAVLFEINFASE